MQSIYYFIVKRVLPAAVIGCSLLFAQPFCTRFVDTPIPASSILAASVYSDSGSIIAALQGAYASLYNLEAGAAYNPSLFADELVYLNASGTLLAAETNTYSSGSGDYNLQNSYYQAIYSANALLEGLKTPPASLSARLARQVQGEARFIRAFSYFQLVNFYGTPPLVLTTDVTVSAGIGNTPADSIYNQIIRDLTGSYALVSDVYPSAERVRANKAVVNALLAKVYLYRKDWVDAEKMATGVIGSGVYSMPSDVSTLFQKTSNETIWQFWQQPLYNLLGQAFIPYSTDYVYYRLTSGLMNAFEAGDTRKAAWTKAGTGPSDTAYYPYKYKAGSGTTGLPQEYCIQLRLAEQYLIRAEARAQQGNITGANSAASDLNVIRNRAGLGNTTAATQQDMLLAIEQERRIELMTEGGHRWFDLNRTGRTSLFLTPIKPMWQDYKKILPYTQTQLMNNPHLQQNPGYN